MKSQMTIGKKIASVCALLLAFSIALGGVALVSMGRMQTELEAITGDALPGVYAIGRAESVAKDIRGAMLTHIGLDDQEQMAQLEGTIGQKQQEFRAVLKDYEKTITRARDRELFSKLAPALDRFLEAWEKPRSLSRASKTQEAMRVFRSETLGVFAELQRAVDDEVEFNKSSGDEFSQQAASAASAARFWTWAILLLAVGCGSALAFLIVRSSTRVLVQAVSELTAGAEQVASAARQVSSSSQMLANGSSEQAASLEETSASSEEINSMAQKNTENSRSAAELVTRSQEKFQETNQALEQTVSAMGEINAQSGKISKIIKVIDEIAFQTNILALNAAVEAARAGDAGLGFAVVADEVRNLAQRCAQAAKDTAALIEESISKSNDGKTRVDEVATAIRAITEESSRIKVLVDEVNLGSQEQARGIEQIAKAILQMEEVTQKTAASAEEGAAAAEELTGQSETLKDVVDRLTSLVGGGDTAAGRRTTAAARNHAAPARRSESGASLTALSKAVSRPSRSGSQGQDVFPLEEQVKSF